MSFEFAFEVTRGPRLSCLTAFADPTVSALRETRMVPVTGSLP